MDREFFGRHRARFLDALAAEESAALVFAARPRIRNHDAEHRYRQDSDFWYLTGLGEPHAALLLLPASDDEPAEAHVFLRDRDPDEELWTGRRIGVDAAPEVLGVDAAHPIEALPDLLGELLVGTTRLMVDLGRDERRDRQVLDLVRSLDGRARSGRSVPRELLDPAPVLHELRLFKDEGELERMRRAAAITAEAHAAVLAAARPGAHEYELDALLEYTFRRRGGSGAAYTPIVAGGANACVLHYVENDDVLRDGDLLLVDAGAEFENYACDVTRTFPVGEAFSAEQRALYEVCLAAQVDAIDAVRAGASYDAPHAAAVRRLAEGLVELGLLKGPPDEAARNGALHRFFPHRTSHWLGLDVHDCGATGRAGEPRPLEPGMVLTVEPGLYVAPDDEEVDARWRGLGIRIEDDVVVTSGDPEVLTAAIPKGVADLEGRRGPPGGRPAVPRGAAGGESAGRGKEDRPPAKG